METSTRYGALVRATADLPDGSGLAIRGSRAHPQFWHEADHVMPLSGPDLLVLVICGPSSIRILPTSARYRLIQGPGYVRVMFEYARESPALRRALVEQFEYFGVALAAHVGLVSGVSKTSNGLPRAVHGLSRVSKGFQVCPGLGDAYIAGEVDMEPTACATLGRGASCLRGDTRTIDPRYRMGFNTLSK